MVWLVVQLVLHVCTSQIVILCQLLICAILDAGIKLMTNVYQAVLIHPSHAQKVQAVR